MSGFTGEGATASMGSILTSPSFLGRRPRRPDRNQGHHSYSQRSHGIIHRIRGCTDTGTFTSPYAKINKQIFGKECDTWWSDHRNNESWMLLKLLKARFPCAQYCADTSTALHSCNFLPVPAPPSTPHPLVQVSSSMLIKPSSKPVTTLWYGSFRTMTHYFFHTKTTLYSENMGLKLVKVTPAERPQQCCCNT